ncbi:MAG: HD domain-containing protein, partial [Lachnospiraceae bacterium]|nr:HD domain-containing protein [Lachnospiraceae bacterium]
EEKEEAMLSNWVQTLPEPYAENMTALYEEMAERKTMEAKVYKAIDGLEAVVQHNISDISTWIPREYELNKTYADDKVTFSEYMTALRAELRKDTLEKIGEKS